MLDGLRNTANIKSTQGEVPTTHKKGKDTPNYIVVGV